MGFEYQIDSEKIQEILFLHFKELEKGGTQYFRRVEKKGQAGKYLRNKGNQIPQKVLNRVSWPWVRCSWIRECRDLGETLLS